MTKTYRTKNILAAASLLAGLLNAGVPTLAQTTTPGAPPDRGGMMQQDTPGADHMGPGMMTMDPAMRESMSRMMGNCNRMMESMMPGKDGGTGPAVPNKG